MVLSYSSDTPELVLADPDLAPLRAVKEGHVLWFPSELASWDYPSMQAVLGLLWCAKTLHPQRFGDVDILEYADSALQQQLWFVVGRSDGPIRELRRICVVWGD